jgi:hypothetical protein
MGSSGQPLWQSRGILRSRIEGAPRSSAARQNNAARTGILLGHVTRNKIPEYLRRTLSLVFEHPIASKGEGWQRPGLVVGRSTGRAYISVRSPMRCCGRRYRVGPHPTS